MEFQSSPSPNFLSPRGEDGGEGLSSRLPFVGIIRIETKKCNFILGNNVKKLRKIRNIRSTADIMPFW